MSKVRQRDLKDLRDKNLKKVFPWIVSVDPIADFIPKVSETWSIKLRKDIITIPTEKVKFESFVKSFFVGEKREKGVIFCWRHMGVVIIVN